MADLPTRLNEILALPEADRIDPLLQLGDALSQPGGDADPAVVGGAAAAMVGLLETCQGAGRQRLRLGELLGLLGDPRLRTPTDSDYWAAVALGDGSTLQVGRFLVTTAEFRSWVESGGYDDARHWSAEGLAWKAAAEHTWLKLANAPDVAHLVIPNHPVAGPTWWEAQAYASAHGARLLTVEEHRFVMRGAEKRPYPWGAPFVEGYANTREEALGRPCAVGLYRNDQTPEGVFDLAGNMGEWLDEAAGEQRVIHPGSWARPSMATWAKAIELAAPGVRSADLSFRIAR